MLISVPYSFLSLENIFFLKAVVNSAKYHSADITPTITIWFSRCTIMLIPGLFGIFMIFEINLDGSVTIPLYIVLIDTLTIFFCVKQ